MSLVKTFSIAGFYESHIHSGPDTSPRCGDDIEIAQGARDAGLAGIVIKNHVFPTGARALIAEKALPGIRVVGGIALNSTLGFSNSDAVAHAFATGSKILWCATKDARGFESAWEKGSIDTRSLSECFRTVTESRGTLGTGHLRGPALGGVIDLAIREGVERIVLNHPDSASVNLSAEEQVRYAELPQVWIERCYLHTLGIVKHPVSIETIAEHIRLTGVENNYISTDLGRTGAPLPWVGLQDWCVALAEGGFSREDLETMGKVNPKNLFFG